MEHVTFIPVCIALIGLKPDTVRGVGRILTNTDFEGCIHHNHDDDTSGEPDRGQKMWGTQPPPRKPQSQGQAKFFTAVGHAPFPQALRFNKADEPHYTIHPKNLNYKPPRIDTGIHSSMFVGSEELEDAIQNANYHTLMEWKEHADHLQELIDLMEKGPSLCGVSTLGPPLLDTVKRIKHARDTLYHKLKYGTVPKRKDKKNSVDADTGGEEEEEEKDSRPKETTKSPNNMKMWDTV